MTRSIKNLTLKTLLLLSGVIVIPQAWQKAIAKEEPKQICTPYKWMGIESKEYCNYTKEVSGDCLSVAADSIYSQCNIFKLNLGRIQSLYDDNRGEFTSLILKYKETNSCGNNDSNAWKCDTFAAYVQFIRSESSNKCYAFVNSALLGIKPIEQSERNDPNKAIKLVAIPGVSRRILFTPSKGVDFIQQSNAILLRTSDIGHRYIISGPAISSINVLELESSLTTKSDNLKTNTAKVRVVRGDGSNSDFLDLSLSPKDEASLMQILSACK
jgi:hypothetical protein